MKATVTALAENENEKSPEIEALQRNVLNLFQQIVSGSPTLSDELQTVAMNIDSPGGWVAFIASRLRSLTTTTKKDWLERGDIKARLNRTNQHRPKDLKAHKLGT